MAKRVSAEDESRLLDVIERAADYVNDGLSPDAAIAKSAEEHDVPSGHLDVLVHAFNTGRTNRQRKAGSSLLEKVADFPIAHVDAVREQLYPAQVKTAAATLVATGISDDWSLPPSAVFREKEASARRMAVSAINVRMPQDLHPEPLGKDPKELMKRAHAKAEQLKKATDASREKAAAAFDGMGETFQTMAGYFKQADSQTFQQVREHVGILFGKPGNKVMDELAAVYPRLTKRANYRKPAFAPVLADEFAALMSQFLDEVDQYKVLKAAYEKTAAENDREAENTLRPFCGPSPSVLQDFAEVVWSFEKKAGPLLSGLIGGVGGGTGKDLVERAISSVQPESPKGEIQKTLDSLTDPNHEAYLRSIRSNAALQDLALNDPVISAHSPDELTGAFNDLVGMAPRAADQPLLLQSLLRTRLSKGHMDPFEIKQLLDMEESMRKRDSQNENRSVLDAPPAAA